MNTFNILKEDTCDNFIESDKQLRNKKKSLRKKEEKLKLNPEKTSIREEIKILKFIISEYENKMNSPKKKKKTKVKSIDDNFLENEYKKSLILKQNLKRKHNTVQKLWKQKPLYLISPLYQIKYHRIFPVNLKRAINIILYGYHKGNNIFALLPGDILIYILENFIHWNDFPRKIISKKTNNIICKICCYTLKGPSVNHSHEININYSVIPGLKVSYGGCGHAFHADCIRNYIQIKNLCPICNKKWHFGNIKAIQNIDHYKPN